MLGIEYRPDLKEIYILCNDLIFDLNDVIISLFLPQPSVNAIPFNAMNSITRDLFTFIVKIKETFVQI